MFQDDQEAICDAIDQRLRDQALVLKLQGELEERLILRVWWTGRMVLANQTIQGVLVEPR